MESRGSYEILKESKGIWVALYEGRSWECPPQRISVPLVRGNIDVEWRRRTKLFSEEKYQKDITSLENKRMEYKYGNDSKLFKAFHAMSVDILRSNTVDSHSKFIHLIEPVDDLSTLSMFRMEKGSSDPVHEDRGILTFIYSPIESNCGSYSDSSLRIMAGSTLYTSSDKVIPPFSHDVTIVTSKYRYSLVFHLRGCSTAQVHKSLTVGDYLAESHTIRSSINKPEAIKAERELRVNLFGSSSVDENHLVDSKARLSTESIVNFIQQLAAKQEREISGVVKMHQEGLLTTEELDCFCNSFRDDFNKSKKQRITEWIVQNTSASKTSDHSNWYREYKKRRISECPVQNTSASTTTISAVSSNIRSIKGIPVKTDSIGAGTQAVATSSSSEALNENYVTLYFSVPCLDNQRFKVGKNCPLKKAFEKISRMREEELYDRYMFGYYTIKPDDTPSMLGMKNGDEIECQFDQREEQDGFSDSGARLFR
jgi:hypothetical protein